MNAETRQAIIAATEPLPNPLFSPALVAFNVELAQRRRKLLTVKVIRYAVIVRHSSGKLTGWGTLHGSEEGARLRLSRAHPLIQQRLIGVFPIEIETEQQL